MTDPQDIPVQVGAVLAGKYRVERVLGAGGMGVVAAARHVDLQELRAIKFLLPATLQNAEAVERFLREARASVRLKSEHVAKVHDVGRLENGAPYIVMEYLEGSDLAEVLRTRGPLPAQEAVAYVLQACEAVAEAHAAGIVHRDLKPANLFLAKGADGTPCVKVLDFGISKLEGAAGGASGMSMTRTTAVLGSPLYMSPEQMRATRDVDARTDIWALGVILYELLTGTVPFRGESLTQLCASVLTEQPSPPWSHRQDLPPGIDAVMLKCLEKTPAGRYQNVGELATALAPFSPSAWSSVERIGRILRLPPGQSSAALSGALPAVAAATGAGVSAGAAGGATGASWGQTGNTPSAGNAARSSRLRVALGAALGVVALAVGLGVVASMRAGGSAESPGPAAALPEPSAGAPVELSPLVPASERPT